MAVTIDTSTPTLEPAMIGIRGNLPITSEHAPSETRCLNKADLRYAAWQNVMMLAINAAVALDRISMEPNGNHWEGAPKNEMDRGNPLIFKFTVGNIPAIVHLAAIGHGELSVHIALWPTPAADTGIQAHDGDFQDGEVFASGWLERKNGQWLQSLTVDGPSFYLRCRDHLLEHVANLDVEALGYDSSGKFFR